MSNSTSSRHTTRPLAARDRFFTPSSQPTPRNTPIRTMPTWAHVMYKDWVYLLSIPTHSAELRGWIAAGNIYRIALTFGRITTQQGLRLLQDNAWFLQQLNQWLPNAHSPDAMHQRLDAFAYWTRPFSVLLFSARFVIDLSVVLKNTLLPNPNDPERLAWLRFCREIEAHHVTLLNDLVWATLNGLTNYATYFKLSIPFSNGLVMAGFLFDISLICWRMFRAHRTEAMERVLLVQQHDALQLKLAHALHQDASIDELNPLYASIQQIHTQLNDLKTKSVITQSALQANVCAAILLTLGFSIPIFLSSGGLVLLCYGIAMLGIALYLSADAYGQYQGLRHQHHQNPSPTSHLETDAAWGVFARSMVNNTGIPLLIMSTLAVSWPAALCLTLTMLGYAYSSHLNHASRALHPPLPPKDTPALKPMRWLTQTAPPASKTDADAVTEMESTCSMVRT